MFHVALTYDLRDNKTATNHIYNKQLQLEFPPQILCTINCDRYRSLLTSVNRFWVLRSNALMLHAGLHLPSWCSLCVCVYIYVCLKQFSGVSLCKLPDLMQSRLMMAHTLYMFLVGGWWSTFMPCSSVHIIGSTHSWAAKCLLSHRT